MPSLKFWPRNGVPGSMVVRPVSRVSRQDGGGIGLKEVSVVLMGLCWTHNMCKPCMASPAPKEGNAKRKAHGQVSHAQCALARLECGKAFLGPACMC